MSQSEKVLASFAGHWFLECEDVVKVEWPAPADDEEVVMIIMIIMILMTGHNDADDDDSDDN